MTTVKAVVTLESTSGLIEDRVQNTFHFGGVDTTDSAYYTAIRTALQAFYNTERQVGDGGLGAYISDEMSRTVAPAIDIYVPSLSGGRILTGAPVYSSAFTANLVAAATTASLPSEVAIVGSYKSLYGTEPESVPQAPAGPLGDYRPRSRRRGRIFVGPLAGATVTITDTGTAKPSASLIRVLNNAMSNLKADLAAGTRPGTTWGVFSQIEAIDNGSIDSATFPVVGGWVDDAFDTQRRRGRAPSTRTTWGSQV